MKHITKHTDDLFGSDSQSADIRCQYDASAYLINYSSVIFQPKIIDCKLGDTQSSACLLGHVFVTRVPSPITSIEGSSRNPYPKNMPMKTDTFFYVTLNRQYRYILLTFENGFIFKFSQIASINL